MTPLIHAYFQVLPKNQPFRSWMNYMDGAIFEHRHYTVLRSGIWKWSTPKRCRKPGHVVRP